MNIPRKWLHFSIFFIAFASVLDKKNIPFSTWKDPEASKLAILLDGPKPQCLSIAPVVNFFYPGEGDGSATLNPKTLFCAQPANTIPTQETVVSETPQMEKGATFLKSATIPETSQLEKAATFLKSATILETPQSEILPEDTTASKPSSQERKEAFPERLEGAQEKMQKAPIAAPKSHIRPLIEARAGYFLFASSKMNQVFNHGGWDFQLNGSYPVWKWLQVYGAMEYLSRHGKSLNGHEKTRIWAVPLSFGLKSVIEICPSVHSYFTLGPRYTYIHVHNNSPYIDRTVNHSGIGGFVGTGFNFFPYQSRLLIDVFGEYSYTRMHFHAHRTNVTGRSIQIGGYTFGAGLGYAF